MKPLFSFAVMFIAISCTNSQRQTLENKNNPIQSEILTPNQKWPWPDSLDALIAAHDTHKLLFENDSVRVLEVTIPPHSKESVHTHRWKSVVYVDSGGENRDFDINGNVIFDSRTSPNSLLKLPACFWDNSLAPHAVENLSDVPIHLIRVELKK